MFSFLVSNNNKGKRNNGQDPFSSEEVRPKSTTLRGISSNMWWDRVRAGLSQRFNLEGIVSAVAVVARDRHLAVPHIAVPDIRWVDWGSSRGVGSVFGGNVVIFSNSAGLDQYDVGGSKARDIEKAIGIHVIRHGRAGLTPKYWAIDHQMACLMEMLSLLISIGVKKPAGTAEDIEKYFGCPSLVLVMVGDRHFTDIVYGNRNGFLTILTEPFSLAHEPFIVRQVRKLEKSLVNNWYQKGCRPTNHNFLSEAKKCVNEPPL
ncbi:hypothetical protein Sjap_000676 [Stephania japonica]|uniref:Uncharacterized protein n=1 Tax=Stephania japonica TaxID=461633 RepID=A0AAP0KII7_9MAGN